MAKKIRGIEGMQADQINFELQRGGKFVMYTFCISALVITFKRASDIYFIRSGENAVTKGLPFAGISLLLGWWGIPWGPIWTISTTVSNLRGGKDVTKEITAGINARATTPKAAAAAAAPQQLK